jgi:hypothetical protein
MPESEGAGNLTKGNGKDKGVRWDAPVRASGTSKVRIRKVSLGQILRACMGV